MMKNTRTLPSIHIPVQDANGSVGWAWYMFFQWVSENVGSVDLSDYFTKEETEELLSAKANIDDLSDVAFSGDYDDLSNKPTIPDAQIQSDWNQADNTKVDYIKNKPTIPTVNNPTITISQGGVTKGSFTLNQASGDTIDLDAGGGGSYHPDLFDVKWADHICNDVQWLRADTFSWQSGAVYQVAYQHLKEEWDAWWATHTTADLQFDGNLAYAVMPDGHRICGGVSSAAQEQEGYLIDIYNNKGVAWYYLIDDTNQRFKLPRTKFGFTGIRSGVGNYVEAGLPNITGTFGVGPYTETTSASLRSTYATCAFAAGPSANAPNNVQGAANYGTHPRGTTFDASRSSSIYGNSDTVQPKATEMYLYFYVGEFTQTALENTAGITTEEMNNKVNIGHEVIAFQAPTAANNYTWYRLYADGWVEQGSLACYLPAQSANTQAAVTFSLPITMADSAYHVDCIRYTDGGNSYELTQIKVTRNTSSCLVYYFSTVATSNQSQCAIRVEGMAA